ncbi:MAG: hypothetical protein MK085_00705 [Phycisphaerales bacterium]|nr:hypothetical protein [Phycisphaerales bacterium]
MTPSHVPSHHALHRGLTLVEALSMLGIILVLLAIAAMLAGAARGGSAERQSAWNLSVLAIAHNTYAMDWEGRQFSLVDDRLGEANGSLQAFHNQFGCHPEAILGEIDTGQTWGWWLGAWGCTEDAPGSMANFIVNKPLGFNSFSLFGSYRLVNLRGFHEYVDGRFYSPIFYAPDSIDAKNARRFFDVEEEFCIDLADELTPLISYSSYILSPAAMFDPAVLSPESQGGWRNPDGGLDTAYISPALVNAKHPHLKTHMIEKDWLRGAPTRFSPYFHATSSAFRTHWFFNHGMDASPLALFYDGSIDRINAGEATRHDEKLRQRTGEGLWSRDTPLGNAGYYGWQASDAEVSTSHTILTTGGILGRDLYKR